MSVTYQNKYYDLKAQAINISNNGGTAQAAVDLSILSGSADFIRDIPWYAWLGGAKTCNVQYTATAVYADRNSNQNGANTVYTVTYTLVNQ